MQKNPKSINNRNLYEERVGLVYARVSSKRQEIEGTGLMSQEGRCKEELARRGIPHLKTFPDSFTGGGDFMLRPAMRSLLEYIDKYPYKRFIVIFDDIKRFARDVEFHIKLRAAFKSRSVELLCLNYQFDESPEGKYFELIVAGGAELERQQNKRQVIQKQKARLDLGYWPFPSKRPYKMVKDPIHGNILKLQYPEADDLKQALEGFADGTFVRKIDACRFLVEKGFWKEKRSPEKYIDIFTKLAEDPLIAGYIEYKPWDVSRRKGHHETLISLETFEIIQKRLRGNGLVKRVRIDLSSDFPLRGLITCAHCEKAMTAAWSKGKVKKHAYYFCQNSTCELKRKSIKKKDIEDGFEKVLLKQNLKEDVGVIAKEVFDSVWREEVSNLEKSNRDNLNKKLDLEDKIKCLSDAAVSTKSEAVRVVYEKQIEDTVSEIEALESDYFHESDMSIPYRTALDKVTGLLKNPYTVWKSMSPREQHELFYFIFQQKVPYDVKEGYRTEKIPSVVRLFEEFATSSSLDVEMAGIEPACKR